MQRSYVKVDLFFKIIKNASFLKNAFLCNDLLYADYFAPGGQCSFK
jgi:hypothetical protein